jgi:amino acid adenylation domain-containing protein
MAIGEYQEQEVQHKVLGENLSEAKRRLLQQYMNGMAPRREEQQIRPRPAGTTVPLSAEQRLVWLHASQHPDSPIYNEPFTVHRYGSFELRILEASMNEILRRHEAWRTSFSPEGEALIHREVCITLPLIDLSGLPQGEREREALRIATVDAQTPIALQGVPLFRAQVVRMSPVEHRLYVTAHHIIFDAISISRIFMPELAAIYASLEQGKPSPLSPLPFQYADYALWQERQVDSTAARQHLAYWIKQLSGELPILHLPEDHPRPAITNHRGSMECFKVPDELVENLRRLCREQGVTLYMTLLAAFKVLLFRYSGQNDLIVGSASGARGQPELEDVMGNFIHTFAIRTRPVAELRFSDYLAQVGKSVLGGLLSADVPFDRVVQEVNPRRDTSRHPIFQAFFSVRPPIPRFSVGWNLTQMDVTVEASKFDLFLEVGERPDCMEARFLYSTEIWDASTIRRMAAHWIVLLQSGCRNPESTLGALDMLTPEETAALLGPDGWNDTTRLFPQATLNALLENQVRRAPHAIAAAFENERWTYAELNSRADVLASSLRAVGVRRGSIVAVALDRSLDLLAGLIAVLKTGAAYLPVDLQMPRKRIADRLADARPSAILTQRSRAQQVASSGSALVLVDDNRENQDLVSMPQLATESAQIPNDLQDTAYLIYTSGTTGEQKAVEISQRSLVNLLASMQASPGFAAEDVFLAVTPVSFDIAALELFLPLISGGMVVIASHEEARDAHLLARAIRRSGCTVMQATPATWRMLLLSGWDHARQCSIGNSSRRLRVLCGGEMLSRDLADRLLAAGVELWNMYGPTETTIWSLIHRVGEGTEGVASGVAIGRPIANTKAFILDERRQALPVGVPGELFLGGVGLAKGYRGRPQQTAERFIRVESVGGLLLYRTGDVAVRRADGTIEVLGRTDNQVKVRGYRVELEAVEAAVLRHPHVAAAAARAWRESTGEFRLCLYVVANNGALVPSLANLRHFLRNILPDCMIPSDVIALPAIPLTPHGKVDRTRLPAPAITDMLPLPVTLRSSEELRLAAIWADLLRCKRVGLDDNFFDLGGHSLLIAMLQQRITAEFGQCIPVVELFHNPTVRQQAAITQKLSKGGPTLPPGVLALQPHGTRNVIFWVHSLHLKLAKAIGEDQPFLVISLTAEDIALLGEAPSVQSIAACQVRKILATQSNGPYIIGGQCVSGVLAYEIASQLRAVGQEVSLVVLLDTPSPTYWEPRDSLARKLTYCRYLMRRTWQCGLRKSLAYVYELFSNQLAGMLKTESARTEMRVAQETMEAAARPYQPKSYDGNVLLVLASDRPPNRNLLPGWQAVVPGGLHIHHVNAHHRDLMEAQNVRNIANAITHHISNSGLENRGLKNRNLNLFRPWQEGVRDYLSSTTRQ